MATGPALEIQTGAPNARQTAADLNQIARAEQAIGSAAQQSGRMVTQSAQEQKSAFKNAGSGMLQLAYIADDLQYGMRGIVNNIPALLSGLGLGAGVAGVASIAAVGIYQLSKELSAGDDAMKKFLESSVDTYNKVADAAEKKSAKVIEAMQEEYAFQKRIRDLQKEVTDTVEEGKIIGVKGKTPEEVKQVEVSKKNAAMRDRNTAINAAVDAANEAQKISDARKREAARLAKEAEALGKSHLEAQTKRAEAEKAYADRSTMGAIGRTAGSILSLGLLGSSPGDIAKEWATYNDIGRTKEQMAAIEAQQKERYESARKRAAEAADVAKQAETNYGRIMQETALQKQGAESKMDNEFKKAQIEAAEALKKIEKNLFEPREEE